MVVPESWPMAMAIVNELLLNGNPAHQALLDATFGPGPRRAGLLRTRRASQRSPWPLTEEGRRQLGVLVIPATRTKPWHVHRDKMEKAGKINGNLGFLDV